MELVDHRYDNAPVVVLQQPVKPGDALGMLQVAETDRFQVLQHLIFQFVTVDHQEDGWFVCRRSAEEQFRRFNHGEGLAAALGMPDEAAGTFGIECALDDYAHRAGLVLA